MISRSVDVMVSNRVDSYVYPIVSVITDDPNRRVPSVVTLRYNSQSNHQSNDRKSWLDFWINSSYVILLQ